MRVQQTRAVQVPTATGVSSIGSVDSYNFPDASWDWSGVDLPEGEDDGGEKLSLPHLLTREAVRLACNNTAASAHAMVLGLFDTGTHLLTDMLRANFDCHIAIHAASPRDGCRPEYVPSFWKHSNIAFKLEHDKSSIKMLEDMDVVPLMMVRSPLSWLQSIRKAGYEVSNCSRMDDWLTAPCLHPYPGGPSALYTTCNKNQLCYPTCQWRDETSYANLQTIWNEWNKAYYNWDQNGFSRGMVIRYEDLVLAPEGVMQNIASYLGLPQPADGWTVEDHSAKTHGHSHGRDKAVQIINGKEYLQQYESAKDELATACSPVDDTLAGYLRYDDCHRTLWQA